MPLRRLLDHAAIVMLCVAVATIAMTHGLAGTPLVLFGVVLLTAGYTVLDRIHHDGVVDADWVRRRITSNLVFVGIATSVMAATFGVPGRDEPKTPPKEARR